MRALRDVRACVRDFLSTESARAGSKRNGDSGRAEAEAGRTEARLVAGGRGRREPVTSRDSTCDACVGYRAQTWGRGQGEDAGRCFNRARP